MTSGSFGEVCSWRRALFARRYALGLFEFHVFIPPDYPNEPPLVNLQTTGDGMVRFNPNLYSDGKVCLSLLGTWSGDQGESWHPKTSTLLQVLMSIQALILVPDPFFNEPGYASRSRSTVLISARFTYDGGHFSHRYEKSRSSAHGDAQSRQYNEVIREATVRHAMIAHLKQRPAELEEVILEHFRGRRAFIMETVRGWASDEKNSSSHSERMRTLANELEAALEKHLGKA